MRILAITPWGSMIGGANRSFLMVISELTQTYDHKIHVVLPEEGELSRELSDRGITWEVVRLHTAGVVLKNEAKDLLRKVKANYILFRDKNIAKKYSKEFFGQYDIVYINTLNAFVGYYFGKYMNLPVIWHLRGAFTDKHYYTCKQKKVFMDRDLSFIAISNSVRDNLQRVLDTSDINIEVIHNGIELNNQRPSTQTTKNGIQCLICGRIMQSKGQLEALRAISELRRKGFDITLNIAGSAPGGTTDNYLKKLIKFCEENNLTSNVNFLGQVDDMAAVREQMNIELVCSECEPFGRCTVEAMQSRLIVIAANTGGTLEIVEDNKNGYLYKQGNYQSLADIIQHVIENFSESVLIADCGYEFAKNHFTMQENVKKINNLLISRQYN